MIRTHIAGNKFRNVEDQLALARLEAGAPLTLVPEPTNPYDPNAVKVHTAAGNFIGYVPREFSSDVASMVDGLTAVWNGEEMEIFVDYETKE